jgi:hypothetical protein
VKQESTTLEAAVQADITCHVERFAQSAINAFLNVARITRGTAFGRSRSRRETEARLGISVWAVDNLAGAYEPNQ